MEASDASLSHVFFLQDGRPVQHTGLIPYTTRKGRSVLARRYTSVCTLCPAEVVYVRIVQGAEPPPFDPAVAERAAPNWHIPRFCAACRSARRAQAPHRAAAWGQALETMRAKRQARGAKRHPPAQDPHATRTGRARLSDLDLIEARAEWLAWHWALGRKHEAVAVIAAKYGMTPSTFRQVLYLKHRPLDKGPIAAYQAQRLAQAWQVYQEHCPQALRRYVPLGLNLLAIGLAPEGFDVSSAPYEPPVPSADPQLVGEFENPGR